jgi:hypothetical protein
MKGNVFNILPKFAVPKINWTMVVFKKLPKPALFNVLLAFILPATAQNTYKVIEQLTVQSDLLERNVTNTI